MNQRSRRRTAPRRGMLLASALVLLSLATPRLHAELLSGQVTQEGEVWSWKFTSADTEPFLVRVDAPDSAEWLDASVRSGKVDGPLASTERLSAKSYIALRVNFPRVAQDYFIVVENRTAGSRSFTVTGPLKRPIETLAFGQTVNGPLLEGNFDFRYYRIPATPLKPITVRFVGSEARDAYGISIRPGSPTQTYVSVEKKVSDTEVLLEVSSPDPKKDHYMVVKSTKEGSRGFTLTLLHPDGSGGGASGDVNQDTRVNVVDVLWLLRSSVGLLSLTNQQKANGDMVADGKTDIRDAIQLLRKVAGL